MKPTPQEIKRQKYQLERARLLFHTEELERFEDCRPLVNKAVYWIKYTRSVRPQIAEELENEAICHFLRRWQNYRSPSRPITIALTYQMSRAHLSRFTDRDNNNLNYSYPEQATWEDNEDRRILKHDLKKLNDGLTHDERLVVMMKYRGYSNDEIKVSLRISHHFLHKTLRLARKKLATMGYH
jgi:DNA-directed RNA polymerase specialized sigma24 family protein